MDQSILLYGTLRTGGYFSRVLPPCASKRMVEFHGIRMYNYYGSYPCAMITDRVEDYVIGELRDYSNLTKEEWDAVLVELDRVENVRSGLFQRSLIDTSLGKSIVYTANKEWFEVELKKCAKLNRPLRHIHDWACEDMRVAAEVKNVALGKT